MRISVKPGLGTLLSLALIGAATGRKAAGEAEPFSQRG